LYKLHSKVQKATANSFESGQRETWGVRESRPKEAGRQVDTVAEKGNAKLREETGYRRTMKKKKIRRGHTQTAIWGERGTIAVLLARGKEAVPGEDVQLTNQMQMCGGDRKDMHSRLVAKGKRTNRFQRKDGGEGRGGIPVNGARGK